MKRIGSYSLIVICCVPILCWFCTFQFQQKALKKSLKSRIQAETHPSYLHTFKFALSDTTSSLEWEHANEFRHKSSMFDILERCYQNDSVSYVCWLDSEETLLHYKLATFWQKPIENQSVVEVAEFPFMRFVVPQLYPEIGESFFNQGVHIQFYSNYRALSFQDFRIKIEKPPEIALVV